MTSTNSLCPLLSLTGPLHSPHPPLDLPRGLVFLSRCFTLSPILPMAVDTSRRRGGQAGGWGLAGSSWCWATWVSLDGRGRGCWRTGHSSWLSALLTCVLMEDFLDACQSGLGAQVEGYLGPVAMNRCPASVIPCPQRPSPPPPSCLEGPWLNAAPTTPTPTPQAPEARLEGMMLVIPLFGSGGLTIVRLGYQRTRGLLPSSLPSTLSRLITGLIRSRFF